MRRTLVALSLFAALSTAPSSARSGDAPAPPPTKSRLYARDPWKADETTTESGTFRQKVFADVAVGASAPPPRVIQTDYTVVRRCREVDASGRWKRGEAWLRRWTRLADNATDRSIEGAFVDIDGDGTWRIAETKTPPSDEARKWADSYFGEGRAIGGDGEGGTPADEPDGELAVGTPVVVRPTVVERTLAGIGVPIPSKGLASNVVLASIDSTPAGARITFTERIDANLVGAGTWNGAAAKFLSGTVFHGRVEVKKTLGACHASLSLHVDHDLVVVLDAGNGPVRGESIYDAKKERTPGGDVPARRPKPGK
jgi:hypothetical protein